MNRPKLSITQPTSDSQAAHAQPLNVTGWLDYVSTNQPTVNGWIIFNNARIPATGGFTPAAVYPNPNWQLSFNINAIPAGTAITVHIRAVVTYPPQEVARTATDCIVINVT
jgi:hypothetical protein